MNTSLPLPQLPSASGNDDGNQPHPRPRSRAYKDNRARLSPNGHIITKRPTNKRCTLSSLSSAQETESTIGNITFRILDWETDVVSTDLTCSSAHKSFDVVLACDCIYNEALVSPFVQTCADACRLRITEQEQNTETEYDGSDSRWPTCCVVAQQLRDPDVFEKWLTTFAGLFHVWRVSDNNLPEALRVGSGYVVHLGILRN